MLSVRMAAEHAPKGTRSQGLGTRLGLVLGLYIIVKIRVSSSVRTCSHGEA